MTKRKLLLKTVAGISAAAMAFSLVSYAPLDWGTEAPYAYQAYALTAPDGYITDSNELMAYKGNTAQSPPDGFVRCCLKF